MQADLALTFWMVCWTGSNFNTADGSWGTFLGTLVGSRFTYSDHAIRVGDDAQVGTVDAILQQFLAGTLPDMDFPSPMYNLLPDYKKVSFCFAFSALTLFKHKGI
jgi:hypothetical protein